MADRLAALSLGAACIVPALGLLWKSSSLRGDVFAKWAERVDIAYAGLSERAVLLLRQLQNDIDSLLGDPETNFIPDLVVEDPGPLVKVTRKFDRIICARRKLRRRFNLMVWSCACAPFLVGVFIVGAGLAVLDYAKFVTSFHFGPIGIIGCAVTLAVGGIVVAAYSYLNWRLTSAEIWAYPERDMRSKGDGKHSAG